MPHFKDAASLPPFPRHVPTAPLSRLSLAKLISGDTEESNRLFEACQVTGFFAVDLRESQDGSRILQTVDPIFGIAENLFELTLAEKSQYSFQPGQPLFGYKGFGVAKVDAKGTPDRCEFWAVSKDDILGISEPRPNPEVIGLNRTKFKDFIESCHTICELVSLHLDRHLGLPPGTLASHQRLEQPAGNQVRLIKTPPQPEADRRTSLVPHTDIGSITVLFNVLGGLQILPPGGRAEVETDWRFVAPEEGCAIINMGDAMVQWTRGSLRSNMHRVTYAPGLQADLTRYSVAYFARPESKTIMAPLTAPRSANEQDAEQELMTAAEWEHQKGIALRSGLNKPQSSGGRQVKGAA